MNLVLVISVSKPGRKSYESHFQGRNYVTRIGIQCPIILVLISIKALADQVLF